MFGIPKPEGRIPDQSYLQASTKEIVSELLIASKDFRVDEVASLHCELLHFDVIKFNVLQRLKEPAMNKPWEHAVHACRRGDIEDGQRGAELADRRSRL
jgi:hypothetical protein